jgi:hypothetical protein
VSRDAMATWALLLLGSAVCCLHECGPLEAAELPLGELARRAQLVIKFRSPAWTEAESQAVAQGLELASDPIELLAICTLESDLRLHVAAYTGDRRKVDVGLCGIRCALGAGGRCTNWPVVGLTPRRLMEPVRNLRAAVQLLERKRQVARHSYLGAYNGSDSPASRYPAKVAAVADAYRGHESKQRSRRVRRLVRLIAQAVAP